MIFICNMPVHSNNMGSVPGDSERRTSGNFDQLRVTFTKVVFEGNELPG